MVRSHARRSGISSVDDLESESVSTDQEYLGDEYSDRPPHKAAPEVAEESFDVHVSPTGDDENDGSEANPVQTLGEAMSRVPKRIFGGHEVRVYLDYGSYGGDSDEDLFLWHHHTRPSALKVIGHDSSNPYYDSGNSVDDVEVLYVHMCGNLGGEDTPELIGINIDGQLKVYDSNGRFKNCKFETGALSNDSLVNGYAARFYFSDCDFSDGGMVFSVDYDSELVFSNCTSSNMSTAPKATGGSRVVLINSSEITESSAGGAALGPGSEILSDNGEVDGWPRLSGNKRQQYYSNTDYQNNSYVDFVGTIGRGIRFRDADNNGAVEGKIEAHPNGLIRATGLPFDMLQGAIVAPRGAPSAGEFYQSGERMIYVSDGSDGNSEGDLVSARYSGGGIVDQVIAPAADDS